MAVLAIPFQSLLANFFFPYSTSEYYRLTQWYVGNHIWVGLDNQQQSGAIKKITDL